STPPLCTPNPMIRRVKWSITTRTQWVLRVADSQRNRSQLHKLSFVWPRKVSQEDLANLSPAGSARSGYGEPYLYRSRRRKPRRSAGQCGESPSCHLGPLRPAKPHENHSEVRL